MQDFVSALKFRDGDKFDKCAKYLVLELRALLRINYYLESQTLYTTRYIDINFKNSKWESFCMHNTCICIPNHYVS